MTVITGCLDGAEKGASQTTVLLGTESGTRRGRDKVLHRANLVFCHAVRGDSGMSRKTINVD